MFRFLLQTACCFLVLLFSLAIVSDVSAQKGSKPTFHQYQIQQTEAPLPDSPDWLESRDTWLTVVVLVLLVVSTAGGIWLRSRRLLVVNAIAAIAVPGFYFGGCPCPVGAIQNIAVGLTRPEYAVPGTILILFLAPLCTTLLFGRTFCGSACPIGAVQELVALKPIKLPAWLDSVLGLVRFFVLGLTVMFACCGLGFLVCRYDPVVGLFRGGTGWASVLVFTAVILALGIVIARPYCRFLCPYGAILSLCGKLAFQHVTVSPGDCSRCQLCEQMCPYNAIIPPSREPSLKERKQGFSLFVGSLVAFPFVVAICTILGSSLAFPLAQLHPIVKRAELVRAEEIGLINRLGAFDETIAHYRSGLDNDILYRDAGAVLIRFRFASRLFGVWCGLVLGVGLIAICVRKKRTDYQADPGRCLSCGRCFWYCPNQKNTRFFMKE